MRPHLKLAAILLFASPAGLIGQTLPTTTPVVGMSSVDIRAVQTVLAKAAGLAFTPDKTDDVLALFKSGPGDTHHDWTAVQKKVQRFHLAWQAKYGQQFSPQGKEVVSFAEPNNKMTELPAGPGEDEMSAGKMVIELAKDGDAPAVRLTMIRDAKSWKVSGAVTETALRDALSSELDKLESDKSNWPVDVDHAYGFAMHHALVAFGNAANSAQAK